MKEEKAMQPIDKTNSILNSLPEIAVNKSAKKSNSTKSDSVQISNTAKVYNNVNKFMNLGRSDRMELSKMNAAEKDEFLKMLATTIQKGIVGYEVLDIKGKPEKHFIDTEIGDQRIKGAKLYKKKGYYKD